ncbi:hypothetical protein HMPREF9098_0707 [Kingella denitrificans ATCC 33394]|uniref:Uncharacterized protein n=1 Tax=Kingella denitrificans ATCC 33394 TaxID=888741 RepID=F0EXZ7_9NEIS|nr:hypothetical protein HMPREF9098_0707 [Kingella denitrificans ATCC 33394]
MPALYPKPIHYNFPFKIQNLKIKSFSYSNLLQNQILHSMNPFQWQILENKKQIPVIAKK